jgi:hypothetical protein
VRRLGIRIEDIGDLHVRALRQRGMQGIRQRIRAAAQGKAIALAPAIFMFAGGNRADGGHR